MCCGSIRASCYLVIYRTPLESAMLYKGVWRSWCVCVWNLKIVRMVMELYVTLTRLDFRNLAVLFGFSLLYYTPIDCRLIFCPDSLGALFCGNDIASYKVRSVLSIWTKNSGFFCLSLEFGRSGPLLFIPYYNLMIVWARDVLRTFVLCVLWVFF